MFPLLNVFEKIGMKNIWGLVIMYGGFGMSMSIFLYHGFVKVFRYHWRRQLYWMAQVLFRYFKGGISPG